MNKVLFVIPDKSYRSQDFVKASKSLNLDMYIVTDSRQASEDLGPKNIFSTNFVISAVLVELTGTIVSIIELNSFFVS